MIWRNLARRPWKAAVSVLAMACAVALLVAGGFSLDAIRSMIRLQFEVVQREHMNVVFRHPLSASAPQALANLPGVLRVEAYRQVPVRLRFGAHEQRVSLMGLEPDAELRRVVDASATALSLPESGLLLTRQLAHTLNVQPGDLLQVEVLEGERNLSPRSDVEEVYLADRPANYRLSCRTTVNGDVTVRTRPNDGVGKGSNSLVGALKSLVGRK
jgi:putative ABC transport system permease protein